MNKNNTSTHITNTPLTIIYFWLDYITVCVQNKKINNSLPYGLYIYFI